MKRKFYIILVLLVAAGIIGYYGWGYFKQTEEWAFSSCLASINSDVHQLGDKLPIRLSETDDWRLLSDSETQLLLESAARSDCKGSSAENLKDPWGNRLLIAYKHNDSGTMFLVWTAGRDKISGNEDDLVHPFKAKTIPIQK